MMTKACTDTDCEFISSCTVQVSLAVLIKNIKYRYMNTLKLCRNIPGKRHKCTIPVGNLGPVQYKDNILPV